MAIEARGIFIHLEQRIIFGSQTLRKVADKTLVSGKA